MIVHYLKGSVSDAQVQNQIGSISDSSKLTGSVSVIDTAEYEKTLQSILNTFEGLLFLTETFKLKPCKC
jgi:hypothetical protein